MPQQLIPRNATEFVHEAMERFPAVGIVGPRQCGKSTLVRDLLFGDRDDVRVLDLERPRDLSRLERAEDYLESLGALTVVLDEVQVRPELFAVLRPLIDADRRPGRFVLLGSASPELVRGANESLAGRITYYELTPLRLTELPTTVSPQRHWVRGGYPESLFAVEDEGSLAWRDGYLETYVTKDLPAVYPLEQPAVMRRLLRMLAGQHGELLNLSNIARALGVAQPTVRRYVDLLTSSFLVRQLPPYAVNVKKRLVKSPKAYLRDSGLLHALLDIETVGALRDSVAIGASFEGYVVEEIASVVSPRARLYFYRTHSGNEVDLVVIGRSGRMACVEVKVGSAPVLTRGFYSALDDLGPEVTYVVAQVDEPYPKGDRVEVVPLGVVLERLRGW